MFRIEMLPAEYGDCLWIEYGKPASPHRVLIDCGTSGVYDSALKDRIKALPEGQRAFELFVVTHVDADHIGGAVKLLKDRETLGVVFKEVWFNGYKQLVAASDLLGPVQGETLTEQIVSQALPWNSGFHLGPVMVPASGALPVCKLADGMTLTLLSPYAEQLDALRRVWEKAVKKAGLVPGGEVSDDTREDESDLLGAVDVDALAATTFKPDPAEANGSSIAFIAEYGGKRVLFGADAHAPVLMRSLARLPQGYKLDAFKIAHHGSTHNTSRELVEAVPCKHYLISSNGKRFKHPNAEAIARIVRSSAEPTLHFNYRTGFNEMWDDAKLKTSRKYPYAARYGKDAGIDLTFD